MAVNGLGHSFQIPQSQVVQNSILWWRGVSTQHASSIVSHELYPNSWIVNHYVHVNLISTSLLSGWSRTTIDCFGKSYSRKQRKIHFVSVHLCVCVCVCCVACIFLWSCEMKSWTESLGWRLKTSRSIQKKYTNLGQFMAVLNNHESNKTVDYFKIPAQALCV